MLVATCTVNCTVEHAIQSTAPRAHAITLGRFGFTVRNWLPPYFHILPMCKVGKPGLLFITQNWALLVWVMSFFVHPLHVVALLCAKNRTPNSLIPNSNFTKYALRKNRSQDTTSVHVIQIVHTLFYSRKILENRRKSCEDRTIVIGVNKSYKLRPKS